MCRERERETDREREREKKNRETLFFSLFFGTYILFINPLRGNLVLKKKLKKEGKKENATVLLYFPRRVNPQQKKGTPAKK